MMKLASVETLRSRLGLDAIPAVIDAAGPALISATAYLATTLRVHSLDRGARREVFIPVNSLYQGAGIYMTALRLRDGFLTEEDPVITGLSVEPEEIDKERGLITVIGPNLNGSKIVVTYDAGFEAADGDTYTDVPEWLHDLALLKGINIMDATVPTPRHESTPTLEIEQTDRLVADTIRSRIRYFPNSEVPL